MSLLTPRPTPRYPLIVVGTCPFSVSKTMHYAESIPLFLNTTTMTKNALQLDPSLMLEPIPFNFSVLGMDSPSPEIARILLPEEVEIPL